MRKLFNKEQEEFIINNYQIMSDTEIANFLGNNVTQSQVTGWRHNNGYKKSRRGNNIFSEEQIQYLKDFYDKKTYKELGLELGFSERQIRGKINHMGLSKCRKINDHYFDNIDTPLKAYFLGYIFADGWIIYNEKYRNYEFGMMLQSSDKYILEKINEELGGNNIISHSDPKMIIINDIITHRHHMDKLRVHSKNLVLGLMKNGINKNKTILPLTLEIDDKFFFDWLRGYIDGDGCFYKSKKHYYLHITCAVEDTLKILQNKLSCYNISTTIYKENERKYRLYCTSIKDMSILINKLYPTSDVFCLTRKYNKIKEYLIGSAA